MKKRSNLIIGIIAILAVAVILLFFIPTPNIIFPGQATAGQIYDDKNITVRLSDDETQKCIDMFAGKWCCLDSPSCGFNDNIYIQIGINKFLPACDGCGIVKSGNKYFTLSEAERETLDSILGKYGINFPCV